MTVVYLGALLKKYVVASKDLLVEMHTFKDSLNHVQRERLNVIMTKFTQAISTEKGDIRFGQEGGSGTSGAI